MSLLEALRFSLAFQHPVSAGGHRGAEIPVPIPNTAVKGPFAEGSASLGRARVGRRRLFLSLMDLERLLAWNAKCRRRLHIWSSCGRGLLLLAV